MRRLDSLGLLTLLLGLHGACTGPSSATSAGAGGSGGTGGTGIELSLGAAGQTEQAGAAPAVEGAAPSEPACAAFAGLDDCGARSVEASFSAANVLLVIDKSSSMDDQPGGFELKKWEALKAALEPALSAVRDEISLGLLLYPMGQENRIPLDCFEGCCEVPDGAAGIQVPVEPGSISVSQVMAVLDQTTPGGGTPTAAALEAALAYFTTGAGKDLNGERFVLLATDGGPNCGANETKCAADRCTPNLDGLCPTDQGNCCQGEGSYCLDDASVVEKIRALRDASVQTFVVGIPGTEAYAEYLNAFAVAGGVPSPRSPDYYAVSAEGGVDGLAQTFADITTHLVRSCEVDLGSVPSDRRLINVAVDCEVVPFEEGAGWDLDGAAPSTLVLAGESCRRIQREGVRRIDVVFGCPTVK